MLVGLVFLLAPVVVGMAVGYGLADNRHEKYVYLKLLGYSLLGYLTFELAGLDIPVGYLAALLIAFFARENKRAKFATATSTFVLWLLSFAFWLLQD